MPVPITYDNIAGGSSEGLLFAGIKFWLALRVPQRNDWIAKIQNNGGEVVKLERMADMLIADHARPKHAPPGSYSWKFVDEATRRGELPDKEDFLVQRPAATNPSAPASSASAAVKTTRTPYTAEDDRVLTQYVRRRLDRAKANGIYEEFAQKNPRHTWQSWKDRWVKRLSLLPGNNVPIREDWEDENGDDIQEAKQGPPDEAASAVSRAREPPSLSVQRQGPPRAQSPELSAPKTRNKFTPEEDERLIHMVDEAIRKGRHDDGKKVHIYGNLLYERFAKKNPTHTAQSWRDRYKHVLAPRLEAASNRSSTAVGGSRPVGNTARPYEPSPKEDAPQSRKSKASPPRPKSKRVSNEIGGVPSSPTPARPSAAAERSAPASRSPPSALASRNPAQVLTQPRRSSPGADGEDGDDDEGDRNIQSSAVERIWSAWKGYKERKSLATVANFPSLAKGYLARARFQEALQQRRAETAEESHHSDESGAEVGSGDELDPDDEAATEPSQLASLEALIEAYDAANPGVIDSTPAVCGETISVWDLYFAFRSQNLSADECDWLQVAEDLGFDVSNNLEVGNKLFECFQRNLDHFVKTADSAMESWRPKNIKDGVDDKADEASSQNVESEDQAMETAREHQHGQDEELGEARERGGTDISDQSPPPLSPLFAAAALKRRHEQAFHSDLSLSSGTPRKRTRKDADVEIPDTPQASHFRIQPQLRQEVLDSSPPVRHRPLLTTSPTLPTRRDQIEPETQSWRLDHETQARLFQTPDLHTDDVELTRDGIEVTPSQQLRSEEDEHLVTPVPLLITTVVAEDVSPPRRRAFRMSQFDDEPVDASTPKPRGGPSKRALGKQPERREPSVSPPPRRDHVAQKSAPRRPAGKRSLPASFGQRRSGDSVAPSAEAPEVITLSSPEPDAPPSTFARPPKRTYAFGTQPRGVRSSDFTATAPLDRSTESESLYTAAAGRPQPLRGPSRTVGPGSDVGDEEELMSSIVVGLIDSNARRKTTNRVALPANRPASRRETEGRPRQQHRPAPPQWRQASTPAPAPPRRSISSEVEWWMSLGYARKPITDLLKATCLSIPLLNQVIDENRRRIAEDGSGGGGGASAEARRRQRELAVPPDKCGVWTEEDDRDLAAAVEGGDGRAARRLVAKHGSEKALRRRWNFLDNLRKVASGRLHAE